MRIYLDQIGCRLNYSEMESLARRLAAAGHTIVEEPAAAQVIVFNSCAVTGGAVRDSRKRVGALHRANGAARIALTGCYATLDPAAAAAMPGVALVAPNRDKELIPLLLEPWSAEFDDAGALAQLDPDATPFDFVRDVTAEHGPGAAPGVPTDPVRSLLRLGVRATREDAPRHLVTPSPAHARTRAFIKVQDGCDNRCTFCIVTSLRGESRSRPLAEVVAEVQGQVEMGVQEAVLTGVHLGSYGRDLHGGGTGGAHGEASDLKQLVAAILTHTDIARLRLSSLEPWELAEGFFDLWARWPNRLCPHLHLPLQAGTDRQLRSMARRCTVESYRRLLQEARAAVPDLLVTTDLIAGFPGESEDDFAAGLAFVAECRFLHAHIFPYSARAGTAAAGFGGQVPVEVKKERVRRLSEAVAVTAEAERARFVGTTRPVLWEGHGEGVPDSPLLRWSGLTDNYLRVQTLAAPEENLRSRITWAVVC